MSVTKTLSAAVIVLASATGAYASSITVSIFDAASYNTGFGAAPNVGEDFETLGGSLGAGEVSDGFSTAVGSFSTLGGTGGGGTVTGLPGNTGNLLALRNGNVYGRENTVPTGGSRFLDSNDTRGVAWGVAIGKKFDAGSFIQKLHAATPKIITGMYDEPMKLALSLDSPAIQKSCRVCSPDKPQAI